MMTLDTSTLRQVPTQERGIVRVHLVLRASAELADEVGFGALTTALIAERSGVGAGLLYDFFAHVGAVVRAVRLRLATTTLACEGEPQ